MPTLFLLALSLIVWLSLALAASTLVVDDADPRILYTGTWTKNPISDPKNFNYGGTLTATNDTTAKATLAFSGAVQVAVFGSFPFAGTFSMHSEYSVDGTGLTQFEPPTVIDHPEYRQQFFVSSPLSTGTHQLVLANLGRSFYLDYILLTLPTSSTLSPSTTPPHSSVSSAPTQSASSAPPQTTAPTDSAPPSSTPPTVSEQPTTSNPQSASSSTILLGSSSVDGGASSLTASSTTTSVPISGSPSSSTSATHIETSQVSPTSIETSRTGGAIVLSAGVYAAIGVGSFTIIVLLVAGVCFLRRRKRARSLRNDVSPFDPGLTSIAAEKSQFSRSPYTHVNRASSTASTVYHSAPPYTPVEETRSADAMSRRSLGEDVVDLAPGEQAGHVAEAGYEPLRSPSAVSPLVTGRSHCTRSDTFSPSTSSPISPSSKFRRPRRDTQELRRRSVDGGVRLAGGPSGTRRDADLADADARSAVSTLPPLYQSYPAA